MYGRQRGPPTHARAAYQPFLLCLRHDPLRFGFEKPRFALDGQLLVGAVLVRATILLRSPVAVVAAAFLVRGTQQALLADVAVVIVAPSAEVVNVRLAAAAVIV